VRELGELHDRRPTILIIRPLRKMQLWLHPLGASYTLSPHFVPTLSRLHLVADLSRQVTVQKRLMD